MSATKANGMGRLSVRERRFLLAVSEGSTLVDAYVSVRPDTEREAARVAGCRMLQRIQKKVDFKQLFAAAGLDDVRLAVELEKRLNAMSTHFYQDQIVVDVEDNSTRMEATTLLARLLGKLNADITLHNDLVVIIPPPKPEDEPAAEDSE